MIVKVCGLRLLADIQALEEMKVQWLGFIFYPGSPRYLMGTAHYEEEKKGLHAPMQEVKKTGVFVNARHEQIIRYCHSFQLDHLQLHGEESPSYCRQLQEKLSAGSTTPRLIKAFRIGPGFDFSKTKDYETSCSYFLFDTHSKVRGGSGKKFNWDLLHHYQGNCPFLLSGGIGPDDASAVLGFHHPKMIGIDINSRFEIAPGKKNIPAIRAFLQKLQPISS
jgi:phosphoribosylanthranilate isomerase